MNDIIFAGASHYGLGGYRSICKYFDRIYLIEENSEEILSAKREQDVLISDFNSVSCNRVFLCGYEKFISKENLEKKTYVNIHGALLPKYRGMHPTFYAIMNGEKELGITFHLVNEYMDAGDIIRQYSFPYIGQSVKEVNDTIDQLVEEHAGEVLNEFFLGRIKPIPQNDDDAIFGAKRNLDDCLVDFSMSNLLLRRFFAALTPNYPYPMLNFRGEKYEIVPGAEIIDKDAYGPTGRVVFVNQRGTWIKTSEGYLIVPKVRRYGSEEEIELSNLVPIGYRFMQQWGGHNLSELDEQAYDFFANNVDTVPDRIGKFAAFFYPDARIRKIYLQKSNVEMGEGTFSNYGMLLSVSDEAKVSIGKNVSIGPGACFVTKSSPNNSQLMKSMPYISDRLMKEAAITIEDDVWIGANVTVLPGVKIGRCSVVGAGSVVINDLEEYGVYAGVPAKRIRSIREI